MSVESDIPRTSYWFRTETKVLEFTIYQADGVTPENITGYSITFEFCQNDYTTVYSKTVGSGIVLTDAVNGVLQVTVDPADTSALTPGVYRYALKRTDAGSEAVLAHGTVLLQRSC